MKAKNDERFNVVSQLWRKKKAEGLFRDKRKEEQWGKDRFVQIKILREIAALHQDVIARLKHNHLISLDHKRIHMEAEEKNLFIKVGAHDNALYLRPVCILRAC